MTHPSVTSPVWDPPIGAPLPSPATPLVRLDGVSASYRDGSVEAHVLDQVTLELSRGETVSVMGTSGSGKSTLLGVIAGLLRPRSGSVVFDGQDTTGFDDTEWALLRGRRIGVVSQSGNLIPFLTAIENIELAAEFSTGDRASTRAAELLDEFGLADRRHHLPRRLSGGEAQRVAVAVALVNSPDLLLADEPTGQLDSSTADEVMHTILAVAQARHLTVLFATHHDEFAARASRRLHIVAGKVVAGKIGSGKIVAA